jgi:gluconate 2-dehydrogenase gamma chain
MKKQGFDRRDFLKTAVVSGAAAAGGTATIVTPDLAQAAQPAPAAPACGGSRTCRIFLPQSR